MASETIKAFLMIALFCGFQALLHLPGLINSEPAKRWRRAIILHRPHWLADAPIRYALIQVQVGRRRG
jgi:hypothetical protein